MIFVHLSVCCVTFSLTHENKMPKKFDRISPHFSALPASKFGQLILFLTCSHLAGKRHALLTSVTVEHVSFVIEAAFCLDFQGFWNIVHRAPVLVIVKVRISFSSLNRFSCSAVELHIGPGAMPQVIGCNIPQYLFGCMGHDTCTSA